MVTINIFSRLDAESALRGPHPYTHILQLTDAGPYNGSIDGYDTIAHRLRLAFDDVVVPVRHYIAVSERDVQKIIDFGRKIVDNDCALIHCEAGISRSTASAFVIWADRLGPGKEAEALQKVLDVRPIARPNSRVVAIAEGLLGRGTALSDALRAMRDRRLIEWRLQMALILDADGNPIASSTDTE